MSNEYNYDDQGQFFPYFVLTVTGLVTLPITYSLLKSSKALESTAPRTHSDFEPEQKELIDKQRWRQKRRERKLKRMLSALTGWLVMAYMVYLMAVTTRSVPKVWDPYDILGLAQSADEKTIKSRYRKLSLILHPDKVRVNEALNQTLDSINDRWVEVTKAFKALTDEDIRNNFIQFGNPDGRQPTSIGIALPKFIVMEGNGKYVLLVYGALLGVLLPFLVGKWWYGTQKLTKDKILISSAAKLFKEYRDDMDEGAVIGALSAGDEYIEAVKAEKDDETLTLVERKVLPEGTPQSGMSSEDREKLTRLDDEQRRKVLGLLWAYLGRNDLGDAKLNEQKFAVAPIAFGLNDSFSAVTLAYGNTQPLMAAFHASQYLIQALLPGSSPLLQLPYFTPKIINSSPEIALKIKSVQSFMALKEEERRKLVVGNNLLSEDQYQVAVKAASQFPIANIEKAFFKVVGERHVTPSSLIQLVVKLRIIPPGSVGIPEINKADLEDIDAKEGDLDALNGRKKVLNKDGKWVKEVQVPVQPPLVQAPYFARDHSPRWMIFLGESKSGKIAVPPFTHSTFDKPVFNEDGTPTFNVQTLRMQFQAPQQAGQYGFTLHMVCDSYVGLDSKLDIIMAVDDVAQAEEIEEEEEISEPDEDTIAGQMSALKGGNVKPKRIKSAADEESSGSDTEGEVVTESETDTDTDTDEE